MWFALIHHPSAPPPTIHDHFPSLWVAGFLSSLPFFLSLSRELSMFLSSMRRHVGFRNVVCITRSPHNRRKNNISFFFTPLHIALTSSSSIIDYPSSTPLPWLASISLLSLKVRFVANPRCSRSSSCKLPQGGNSHLVINILSARAASDGTCATTRSLNEPCKSTRVLVPTTTSTSWIVLD